METDREHLYRVHLQDQARAALQQADETERRSQQGCGYPLWFWLCSGLGLSALPLGVHADGALADAALLAGCGLLLVTFLLGRRDRRVREQCHSLGARGWRREIAIFLPAIAILDIATVAANVQRGWGVTAASSAAILVAWVGTGLLSGRVTGEAQ